MKLPWESLLNKYRDLGEAQRNRVIAAVAGGIVLLNIVFFLAPLLMEAVRLRSEASSLRSDLDEVRSNTLEIPRLDILRGEIQAQIGELEQHVIRGDLTPFLKSLSAMAHASRVQILELVPVSDGKTGGASDGKGPQDYATTGFQLRAESGYHALGEFISKLESHATFIRVSGVRINGNLLDGRKHKIFVELQMVQKSPPAGKT